ncbi:MAG: hypothetical protein R3F59_31680 [Myxococcota bacterium]
MLLAALLACSARYEVFASIVADPDAAAEVEPEIDGPLVVSLLLTVDEVTYLSQEEDVALPVDDAIRLMSASVGVDPCDGHTVSVSAVAWTGQTTYLVSDALPLFDGVDACGHFADEVELVLDRRPPETTPE